MLINRLKSVFIIVLMVLVILIFLNLISSIVHPYEPQRDYGPWITAEVKYENNTFVIKNCDDFDWTNIVIELQSSAYRYKKIGIIEPSEIYVIEFDKFINTTGTFGEIGTPFDGKKRTLTQNKPGYIITIDSMEGASGHSFYEEGEISKTHKGRSYEYYQNTKILKYIIQIIILCILIFLLMLMKKRIK